MAKNKLGKRNLISTITECLKEHEVEISDGHIEKPMYLIEVNMPSNLYGDFLNTYKGEVDDFKKKLAKKVMDGSSDQVYGILIGTDLKYNFAFNRKFADLDREKKKITFKKIEDVLLEQTKKQDLSEIVPEATKIIEKPFPEAVFRYATIAKKTNTKKSIDLNAEPSFEKTSLLNKIKANYEKNNLVKIKIDGKISPFYLITTSYVTNTSKDFLRTYNGEIKDFQKQLAEKILGKGKKENEYLLLLNKNLKIKYVFNTAFVDFTTMNLKKEMKLKSVEEVLLEKANKSDNMPLEKILKPSKKKPSLPGFGPHMVLKYALIGKN